MRLIRWFRYGWTRRYAVQILIYRSRCITRHVVDVRRVMIGLGYPLGEINDLWNRSSVSSVLKRHSQYFR